MRLKYHFRGNLIIYLGCQNEYFHLALDMT